MKIATTIWIQTVYNFKCSIHAWNDALSLNCVLLYKKQQIQIKTLEIDLNTVIEKSRNTNINVEFCITFLNMMSYYGRFYKKTISDSNGLTLTVVESEIILKEFSTTYLYDIFFYSFDFILDLFCLVCQLLYEWKFKDRYFFSVNTLFRK